MSADCTQLEEILTRRPDEALSPAAFSHLDSCSECRSLWEELEAIRSTGLELGAEAPEPPARIWTALREQLQTEGLIREEKPAGWFADWFGFSPRFAFGAACLATLAIAFSLIGLHIDAPTAMRLDTVHSTASQLTAPAVTAELNKTLDSDLERVIASLSEHDASLATSVRENIGVVDNLISLCEQSVRDNPDNPMAREYLYGAYQQKATLLAAAIDRSAMENR